MVYSAFIYAVCATLLSILTEGRVCDGPAGPLCELFPDSGSGGYYPKFPLTFKELDQIIMAKKNESRLYYEIYSLDPKDPTFVPSLPVLRKIVIRWNLKSTGYTNNYAGWLPPSESFPSICVSNEIQFTINKHKGTFLEFKFNSEFPKPEPHIGTIFSSYPERYHINWYCPESQLVRTHGRIRCLKNLRMSVYSAYGPHNLPKHLIIKDLFINNAPSIEDPRWVMTYDAPEQCMFTS